jgi:hypothetical protein
VPRQVFRRFVDGAATPERCLEAFHLQRTRFELIAERKLRNRQLTDDGCRDQWPRYAGGVADSDECRVRISWREFSDRDERMAASSKLMVAEAERRFPVRIRVAVPPRGFGKSVNQMQAWLDETAGADGWAMTPSGSRSVVNDAIAIYFADATIARAFVARWCAGHKAEAADGLFRVREDEPTPRIAARPHKTP